MKTESKEILEGQAAIKGTMLNAHLAWAKRELNIDSIKQYIDQESLKFLDRSILATEWIPLRCLIQIDRAIASAIGGTPEQVYRSLGSYSAYINLNGIYKKFVIGEPHHFFNRMTILHEQYQNFGSSKYQRLGDRTGRILIEQYQEYSPVYCASAIGYFEEALRLMKAPGPIIVVEKTCQCWGESICQFELSW